MVLGVVSFMLVMALLCSFLQKNKAVFFFITLALGLIFFSSTRRGPAFLLANLGHQKKLSAPFWQETKTIILLGGGLSYWPQDDRYTTSFLASNRLMEALRLYKACQIAQVTCQIFISGGDPMRRGVSEAKVMAFELEQQGVAQEDMILEEESKNTYENAMLSAKLLKQKNIHSAVLVTSGYHLRRAQMLFENFGLHTIPAASDFFEPNAIWLPTSFNMLVFDVALHESLGRLQFLVYEHFGLNNTRHKY